MVTPLAPAPIDRRAADHRPHGLVVGGGLAGLLAAERLSAAGWRTTLLEASERLGGVIRTTRLDGLLLEDGPDALLASKPAGLDLVRRLGLEDDLVSAAPGSAAILRAGHLHPIPEGSVLGIPTRAAPLLRSRLLTALGKARLALDLVLPRGTGREGESVDALLRRRLGAEATERLVGPLLAGIHAGAADRLGAAETFPQLVAMERDRGSLVRGARALARRSGGARPMFLALRGGMDALVSSLVARLGAVTLETGARAHQLQRDGRQWRVHAGDGRSWAADAVVLAVAPPVAATLLGDTDPDAGHRLAAMSSASTAIVHLVYAPAARRRMSAGHGFIVTPGHTTALSALTDVTRKWPGRVPDGRLVLRAYAGDAATRELADDAALLAAIRGDVEPLVGLSEPPALALVRRWPDSMPQLGPGHAARVATIEASIAVAAPGIALAGAAYGGVGIPAVAASVPAAVDALLERVRAGAAASS